MSEREGYDPGVPCWVEAIEPDPAAAAAFYSGLLGWELERRGDYVVARLRGRDVAGIAPLPLGVDPPPAPGWHTHVRVVSADRAAEQVLAAGGSVVAAAFDVAPAGRMAVLADPAGGAFCAWEPGLRHGAGLVNEPGAWSMSRLDTPDPDRAAAFYADVFGWTTESFDLGDATITMFRLPGYVGGEPGQPVSREVVATMAPAPAGAPAAWAADFWVGDMDRAVAAAGPLGGALVQAPVDIGIGRSAVLADPAGATFSLTQIGPPAAG
jgi:predicted enzyme related to lactoylglutathione lyase